MATIFIKYGFKKFVIVFLAIACGALTFLYPQWQEFARAQGYYPKKPYVIFLPGFVGSRLWAIENDSEKKLWVAWDHEMSQLKPDDDGTVGLNVYTKPLDSDNEKNSGILAKAAAVSPIYKEFLDFLDLIRDDKKAIAGWEAIPYDWRKSVEDIADGNVTNPERGIYVCDDSESTCTLYYSIVQRIQELKNEGFAPVTLVGHSNGGLLAKAIITELENLPDIGVDKVHEYVNRVFLVASPQLGTPKALGGMLHGDFLPSQMFWIKDSTVREAAETMRGAYGLLPSPRLLVDNEANLIEFNDKSSNSPLLNAFIEKYGTSINSSNPEDLWSFLTGQDDRPDSNIYANPNVLSPELLASTHEMHARLDNWETPPDVDVIQIVGTGRVDTPRGLSYHDEIVCLGSVSVCVKVMDVDILLADSSVDQGDGTVVPASAKALETHTYSVKLTDKCTDGDNLKHMNILGSKTVQNIIQSSLRNVEYTPNDCVESTRTGGEATLAISGDVATPARRWTLRSPANLHVYDEGMRHTGFAANLDPDFPFDKIVEENIPNSSWSLINDHETIVAEAAKNYRVRIEGTGMGAFTLVSEEFQGDGDKRVVIFGNVPVTPSTIAEAPFPEEGGYGNLEVDFNGDGVIDSIVTASVDYDPSLSLHALSDFIRTLDLPKGVSQSLLSKVQASIKALSKGNPQAARGSLGALINFVNAQTSKKIPSDVAFGLKQIVLQINASII